jgi:hypothetical protein
MYTDTKSNVSSTYNYLPFPCYDLDISISNRSLLSHIILGTFRKRNFCHLLILNLATYNFLQTEFSVTTGLH